MQYFYINQGSVNPTLRIELINDGRFEFLKSKTFNNAIQNAEVTFTMKDENDILKISDAPCNIIRVEDESCTDMYVIEYKWNKRDTKKKGTFKGQFTINFKGGIKDAEMERSVRTADGTWEQQSGYPEGDLIVPIYEDLYIMVK